MDADDGTDSDLRDGIVGDEEKNDLDYLDEPKVRFRRDDGRQTTDDRLFDKGGR
jgi:hypothetical protein